MNPILPNPEHYVTIEDGHITLSGKRVRYWGAIGHFPAKTHAGNEAVAQRLYRLGFNMVRYWAAPEPYHKGDGSRGDLVDHFLWCCQQEGMRIWFAGLNGVGEITEDAVSLADDPGTAEEWKEAVRLCAHKSVRDCAARYWDPRIQALAMERMRTIADHVNQYTGFRYADDPLFAVWELSNEEWWFHRMKRGEFTRLAPFFHRELFAKWNQFLRRKHGDDDGVRRAWFGNLLPEESAVQGTVLLLPLLGDVNDEQAAALGVGVQVGGVQQKYDRTCFNNRRGADVIEFLLSIWIAGKRKEADAVKSWGRSCQLSPLVWDTGIGWDLPTQYLQQHSDAVCHDSYFNGTFHTDPNHKRFPWMSMLEELPKVCWDRPWLEHNRVEGKPFFVYETQIMQPAKYRVEYPMQIARLAAIQDWDIICWHYWGFAPEDGEEHPYDKMLDYVTRNHYPNGYHYQYDEVQQSAMTAAAEIFKNGLLRPAPDPTRVIVGRKSLFNWEMNGYGELGRLFLPTVYRYGMRLLIDPNRDDDEVAGPCIKDRGVYEACPIMATEEITHDWQKGHLVFDAPGVAMYAGFMANYGDEVRFRSGVVFRKVVVTNPEGIAYPVKEDEKYLEFCLTSCDGLPLTETRYALVSLMSTSFNTGFSIDEKRHAQRPFFAAREWFWDMDTLNPGSAPVLVARIEATIEAHMCAGMRYRMLDWHFNEVKRGRIGPKGRLSIPGDLSVFLTELTR